MLSVGLGVITHLGHVEDVDGEEAELADDGLPAELGTHPGGVALLHLEVVDNTGGTAHLDLDGWLGAGDDAVDGDARVRLRSSAFIDVVIIESHSSPSMTKGSTPLMRAEPSRPGGADQDYPGLQQLFLGDRPQARLLVDEVGPRKASSCGSSSLKMSLHRSTQSLQM